MRWGSEDGAGRSRAGKFRMSPLSSSRTDARREMVPDTFFFLPAAAIRKGRLASNDCGDVGLGIDDAVAGEAEEAVRKVAGPFSLFN